MNTKLANGKDPKTIAHQGQRQHHQRQDCAVSWQTQEQITREQTRDEQYPARVNSAAFRRHVYDEAGQLLTGSFMDYVMPKMDILTGAKLYEHCIPSPTNLLGAKGAGEAGTTGAIPTLANAVIDALRPLGINHLDFPYSPARIWKAITDAD